MRPPSLFIADWQFADSLLSVTAGIHGGYVPARPLGCCGLIGRIRLAWMVFTGRADALRWIGQ